MPPASLSLVFLGAAWLQSVAATVISLYISNVLLLPPCDLCWYQRMCMYPLVVILGVALCKPQKNLLWLSLPFCVLGLTIAAYHTALQEGWIPEPITNCLSGISCATKSLEIWGFLTIPMLSLIGFTIITVCLLLSVWFAKRANQ